MASFLQPVRQKVRTSQKRGAARSFTGAQGVPGPSPYNAEAGSWRRGCGVQRHHVCPAPSSTPPVPPRQRARRRRERRGRAPCQPRIGSCWPPGPIRGRQEGPRPVSRTPRCSEVSSRWLLRRPGAKNKLQTTSPRRSRGVVMATGPQGPAERSHGAHSAGFPGRGIPPRPPPAGGRPPPPSGSPPEGLASASLCVGSSAPADPSSPPNPAKYFFALLPRM